MGFDCKDFTEINCYCCLVIILINVVNLKKIVPNQIYNVYIYLGNVKDKLFLRNFVVTTKQEISKLV